MIPFALDVLEVCAATLARAPAEAWLAAWFDELRQGGHHPDSYRVHELPTRAGDPRGTRRFVATLK